MFEYLVDVKSIPKHIHRKTIQKSVPSGNHDQKTSVFIADGGDIDQRSNGLS